MISVVAGLLTDPTSRALLVRKRGTRAFMQPGGKPEPGETPRSTLIREIAEEIGLHLDPERLDYLGEFTAPAANEAGQQIHAHAFAAALSADEVSAVTPATEIAEVLWVEGSAAGFTVPNAAAHADHTDAADAPDLTIAPLSRDHLLPLIAQRASSA